MLLLGLAEEARRRLKDGGESSQGLLIRDIAQLVWALGTLQADNFRLADDLVCSNRVAPTSHELQTSCGSAVL
jgi:hypothetical protein